MLLLDHCVKLKMCIIRVAFRTRHYEQWLISFDRPEMRPSFFCELVFSPLMLQASSNLCFNFKTLLYSLGQLYEYLSAIVHCLRHILFSWWVLCCRIYSYSHSGSKANSYTDTNCRYTSWILYPTGRQISKVYGQSAKGKPSIHEARRRTVLW